MDTDGIKREDNVKEKDLQADFKRHNIVEGVFELKLIKITESGKVPPFPFSSVKDHQIEALNAANDGSGLYHKISDSFVGDKARGRRFPAPKPFDCLFLKSVPAYVVVCYYIPRKLKMFCYLQISTFLHMKEISKRLSMPNDLVELMSTYILRNGEYVK